MQETKKCTKCGEVKLLEEFSKNRKSKDNLMYECKLCRGVTSKQYLRTIEGFFADVFNSQTSNSKERGHPLQDFTKRELITYAMEHLHFIGYWYNYVDSDYDPNLRPSFDRLDNDKPYTLGNIQILAWGEHCKKSGEEKMDGRDLRICKAVVGTHKETRKVVNFHSLGDAEKQTGVNRSNISNCCKKKRKRDGKGYYYTSQSAGGYIWKFKEYYERLK